MEEYKGLLKVGGVATCFVILAIILLNVAGMFGYVWADVGDNEVGMKFSANQPYEVVSSGKWTEFGLFKSIRGIKVSEMPFRMSDDEVLTFDKQRIGVVVTGTVRRPGRENPHVLLENWARYKSFYLDDVLLVGREEMAGKEVKVTPGLMQSLGQQAAKVCVGDLPFDKAVIGSARDDLRECINKELSDLASGYGLSVSNVVVPNIILNSGVQKQLDAITEARLAKELADQRKLQATAEAQQEQARQQGQILVEQGRVQEKAKQDKITADLEKQVKDAQYSLIEKDKVNILLAAQKDKEIADVNRQTAEINAKSQLAPETTKAQLYQASPDYVALLKVQAESAAYKETDKIIVLPSGTNPLVFIGEQNVPVNVQVPSGSNR